MITFQKFNEDTLVGRYIKSLLAQVPIPMFQCVSDHDIIIKDNYYIYKQFIIKCVESGALNISEDEKLFPSNTLYPTKILFPSTGKRLGTFLVIDILSTDNKKLCSTFISNKNYYDSLTHRYLHRYLKYLKTTKGLDLFSFYNIYDNSTIDDTELKYVSGKVVDTRCTTSMYKVLSVPIHFNQTYNIHIDCSTPVLMKCVYRTSYGYYDMSELDSGSNLFKLKNTLEDAYRVFSSLSFKSPVSFRVETLDKDVHQYESSIQLLIQLPKSNNSSIVVFEGKNYSPNKIKTDLSTVLLPYESKGVLNPSLIYLNSRQTYAFSSRLIEYLLDNVIHAKDTITQNIEKVQQLLSLKYKNYRDKFINETKTYGVWDKSIASLIYKELQEESDSTLLFDHDFNINSDVERILSKKGTYGDRY